MCLVHPRKFEEPQIRYCLSQTSHVNDHVDKYTVEYVSVSRIVTRDYLRLNSSAPRIVLPSLSKAPILILQKYQKQQVTIKTTLVKKKTEMKVNYWSYDSECKRPLVLITHCDGPYSVRLDPVTRRISPQKSSCHQTCFCLQLLTDFRNNNYKIDTKYQKIIDVQLPINVIKQALIQLYFNLLCLPYLSHFL